RLNIIRNGGILGVLFAMASLDEFDSIEVKFDKITTLKRELMGAKLYQLAIFYYAVEDEWFKLLKKRNVLQNDIGMENFLRDNIEKFEEFIGMQFNMKKKVIKLNKKIPGLFISTIEKGQVDISKLTPYIEDPINRSIIYESAMKANRKYRKAQYDN